VILERHRSQNEGSLKSNERLSDFKERCARLCCFVSFVIILSFVCIYQMENGKSNALAGHLIFTSAQVRKVRTILESAARLADWCQAGYERLAAHLFRTFWRRRILNLDFQKLFVV
jgi:hypothetical protein